MKTYRDDPLVVLGDPTRRAIFELLVASPRAVVDISDALPVSRPAISQHLKLMKEAGLVSSAPAGTKRIYSIDMRGLMAMRRQLDVFWTKALANYKAVVEQPEGERS